MAALGFSVSGMSEALKLKYTRQNLALMGYMKNTLFAILPKDESFGGRSLPVPIWHKPGIGRGTTVAQAQSNQSAAAFREFLLTRAKNYGVHSIDRESLKASVGNEHSFIEAEGALMDEVVYEMTRDIANDLYKSGDGSRGTVGSIVTTTLTLANPSDVVNFEVGMTLHGIVNVSGQATGAARAGSAAITAIDRNLGTLTTGTDWTTQITSLGAGDHLVLAGDSYVGTVGGPTNTYKKVVGLAGWIPSTAPGATSFFGVDRSTDTTRLGGIREDGSSKTVAEAIIDAGTRCYREGATPDIGVVNPIQWAELSKALDGKATLDVVKSSDGVVGFSALKVRTGAGEVPITMDVNCPVNRAYLLEKKTWKYYTLGAPVDLVDEDGVTLFRSATADQFEVRFASYGQLGCNAPGKNCVVTLAV